MKNKDIVFLHGWGGSLQSLIPLANELKKMGFNTHNFEMPGHGNSPEMSYPWDMEDFAKWTLQKIQNEKITNPILIGHSFGGKIILELLTSNLLNPSKVVLIDANGIKAKNTFKKSFWKFIAHLSAPIKTLSFVQKFRLFIYKYIIKEVDYAKTTKNIKESFKLFNEQSYDEKLKNINTEVLIIWGKDDSVTPLWMGEKLHQNIKNSELKVLEGTHGLPLKKPEDVAYLIQQFIEKN